MKIVNFFLIMFILLMVMHMGKIYNNDNESVEKLINVSIYIQQEYLNTSFELIEYNSSMNIEEIKSYRITNIVNKIVDTIISVGFDISMWSFTIGFENTYMPYQFLALICCGFCLILLLEPIIFIFAMIYLIYIGIKYLVVRFKNEL